LLHNAIEQTEIDLESRYEWQRLSLQ